MPKKKPEECPPKGSPAYMTTYGDMMTLLLTFFVLLLSFSSMQEAKFRRAIGSLQGALGVMPHEQTILEPQIVPIPQLTNLQESEISESIIELQEAAAEMDISEAVRLEITEEGIHIDISDSILFDVGNDTLKSPIRPFLQSIAELVIGWPNTITIEGHTDTDPIRSARFSDNWDLSYGRTMSVLRFFKEEGVPEDTMIPIPRGEFRPMESNDTTRGKARNRRIEILVRYDRDTELPGSLKSYIDTINK